MNDDVPSILNAPIAASVTAEQSALGAILSAGDHASEVAQTVFAMARPEMFWRPQHELLARVLHAMADADIPIDPQTVLARLRETGELSKVGGGPYLHTLMQHAWSAGGVSLYAREVRDCYRRRQIREATLRVLQQASNPEVDLSLLLVELATATDRAEELAGEETPVQPATVADLLAYRSEPDWLIPGLLERRERVMITGFEGLGKSVVLAQLAVSMVAGVHPFLGMAEYDPRRVLVVDAENSKRQLSARYRWILNAVQDVSGVQADRNNLMVEVREEGLDLTQATDVTWLDRLLTGGRPDALVIGPLYKLHRSNMNDESAARELAHTLDMLRMRHNVAVLIEAHAGQSEDGSGKRKLRPRGSSLFLGWPNVGIGIRPHPDCPENRASWMEVKPWRGHREERDWPTELVWGTHGELPWMVPSAYHRAVAQSKKAS
jgi:replicative DNA helicase